MSKRFSWLSPATIAIVVLATYYPALKIQFYDGWWYLIWAATMDLPRYLIQFLDPANITQGYRPVQGLYLYLLFHLFGFNPDGYHLAHTLLHAVNAILLFLIVRRISHRDRLALITAIVYAVLPNYSLAVFWHAVVDPLAGFFYLLTLLLWTRYLETHRTRDYALTFAAFVFALLSKEIAVFLPVFMYLIEWWFYDNQPNPRADVPRYAPFILMFFPYLYLVYQVQSHGEFVGQFGFRIGTHMLANLIPYLAVLAFPWSTGFPNDSAFYLWLALVASTYVLIMLYRRSKVLLFLAAFAILNVFPLLGFPQEYFDARYLYLSTAASAIVLALMVEIGWRFLGARRVYRAIAVLVVALIVLVSGARVAEAAAGLAEYTRQIRVPFRDISWAHPTFPHGTYLYFVHSPRASVWDFEGLFFSRYGENVTVNATEGGLPANLRNYATAYVYYFDSTGKPIEVPVDKDDPTRIAPSLPVRFQPSIILEKYEVPSGVVYRGKALVAVLLWRVSAAVKTDYMVLAVLVDETGKIIARYDTPLLCAGEPTSQWRPTRQYVDAVVLPVDADAPAGRNYRLEIGLYDPATLQRLPTVNEVEQVISDVVVIEPFSVTP